MAVLAVLVPGAYAADTFEPNDTRQTAAALPFGVALSSYLFTSNDEDWYRVVTPRAGHLRVTLDVPDGVDYSLSISDFSGYYIDVSNLGSGLDEEVWLTSRAFDSFFVRVSSSGDHSEMQPYTLSTTLSFSDDTYEDNGNPQDGRRIAPGTYRSKVHSISDTDCFRFELWTAGTFSVTLDVPPSADLRLDLYSVSGDFATLVEASANDGAGVDESIARPVTGPGKFYLVVTGDDASTFEEYALTLTGSTIRAPHAVRDDFDRYGGAGLAVYGTVTGVWHIRNQSDVQFGQPGDIPVAGDYNGDNVADIAVYRPSTGTWYVRDQMAVQFGEPGDVPVPADYNGDLYTDIAVYRPSTGFWYVRNQLAVQYGSRGDVPIPADYDGDGDDDVAVYKPSTAHWFVRINSPCSTDSFATFPYRATTTATAAPTWRSIARPWACGTCAISSSQSSAAPATARPRATTTATATRTPPSSSCLPASGGSGVGASSCSDRPATCRWRGMSSPSTAPCRISTVTA